MKKKILLFFLIFILAVSISANAERELRGDQLNFEETESGQLFEAAGNVELVYDELRITAEDEGLYHRYNGEIEFRQNVQLYYQEFEAQAVELTGNLEQEVYHLNKEAEVKNKNSLIQADQIDFFQAESRIEVEGNAYLEYNNFWAKADNIVYDLAQEQINLSGNVRGERNGEHFNSETAVIEQKKEEIKLSGQAAVNFKEESID